MTPSESSALPRELQAIHEEKLEFDGIDTTPEERALILEHRGIQFGLILGRSLRSSSVDSDQIERTLKGLMANEPASGTSAGLESGAGRAITEALAEFRKFLGLPPQRQQDAAGVSG